MLTTVRLSDDVAEKLTKLADETGRTKSFYLRKLIEGGLDQLLYEYSILHDVEDYRKGKLKTYTLEKMKQRYGLED